MKESTSSKKNRFFAEFKSILLWVAIALFLRWQVIEPRWIPSGSMLPTLYIQDKILIEKVRPKLNRVKKRHLNHENIVVFDPPQILIDSGYDPESALIKRVVGLPGDQIAIHDGSLYRNGELIKETWIKEQINYEMESLTVPLDSLWVLGDNRNNSLDSHLWGPLPEEKVLGTAIWRYWPIDRFGPLRFPHP